MPIEELDIVPSGLDIEDFLTPTSSPAAHSIAPGALTEGKLRFELQVGDHLSWDDPILLPGRYGQNGHLHHFYGNTLTDAGSTYESLRSTGGSTSAGGPLNRTAYWFPALIDITTGKVRKPHFVTTYYQVDPPFLYDFTSPAPEAELLAYPIPRLKVRPKAIWFPRGFRFISGFNHATNRFPPGYESDGINDQSGNFFWSLDQGPGANAVANYGTLGDLLAAETGNIIPTADPALDVGATGRLFVRMNTEVCFDGRLTSDDGRAHVAHPLRDYNGNYMPPTTHPYTLPALTVIVWWPHDGEADLANLRLSSDWHPAHKHWHDAGTCWHVDWFGAWEDAIIEVVKANIHGMPPETAEGRDTSGGDLGNDTRLSWTVLGDGFNETLTIAGGAFNAGTDELNVPLQRHTGRKKLLRLR
jgi:hypothetical protein